MTTKCLVFSLWLQLFIGFVLWNFIRCDCPFPKEKIINGEYKLDTRNCIGDSKASETCILFFHCFDGYELIGEFAIQCLDGEWTGRVPSCKAMECSAPPRISNATYTVTAKDRNEIRIGTQAIYSCNPGYELSDPSVSSLACMLNEDADDTLWAGDIPACQPMKPCSDPGFSLNGTREGACCLPGNVVSYSCNEGFEMVGEEEIECLPSSRWSSPRPLCKPLEDHCELPPQIPHGVVLRKSGDYALTDQEVEIRCEPGYKLNETNQFPYCNKNGTWEDEFGECIEIMCDRPEPLENGNIPELEKSNFTDTFPNNFVLTYDCDEGYRLKGGEPWRVCRQEGWSGSTPNCEEIFCPDPGAPEQGRRLGDSFKVGARVRFRCFTGYELLGSSERYCSPNGKWIGELARCNAPTNYCPNPGIPINGMKNGATYNEGDTVQFSCRPGFIHSGSKQRTCMADGTWNGTETKCLGPHDFDSTEEIGRNLKNRLNEQFDEEIRQYKLRNSALGLTGMDGRVLEIPTNGRLVMYFAFDVSGSIEKGNFKKGIEFAKAVVKKIGVSENGARVGAIVFSSEPVSIFYPMDHKTTEDVLQQLDAIEYLGGGTAAKSALEQIIGDIKLVEQQKDFDQNTMKSVLFLITDGKANMGGSPDLEADILKNKMKVEIFCIGITGDTRSETLFQIASTSKYGNEERANVFILKNYERLNWLIQDLTNGTIDYGQCGLGMESKMNSNEGKMIGGEKSVEPWPWMAALFFRDPKKKGSKPELKCGGSVINGNFILTAAHCLFEKDIKTNEHRRKNAEEIIVKLGLVVLKNETLLQEFQVKELYIHKDYIPGTLYDNDIALLRLDRPIVYGPFIRPVCLPPAVLPEDDDYPLYKPNENGWVIGFGHERQVKPFARNVQYQLSKQLKELSLPIQSNPTCRASLRANKDKESFTERMFCAGDGVSGNDTCKGDSGGPFMQHQMNSQGQVYWTQVGIVSWGIGCGNKKHYGFYTRVHKFRDWIDETIKIVPEEEEDKK